MSTAQMKIANLDEASLAKLKKMEEAFGSLIIALEPHRPFAELDAAQVKKLQELEKELGVTLIAFDL